ncbi:recombinase family protein [Peptostreptococcus sp. D1]|uniref:recombinase family protein n=1 Tax=Peptostreptococcus sp. D1 TaxID=72304 RepID=UPI003FA6EAAC
MCLLIYGYCRATTSKQVENGYLDEQEKSITERYFGCIIVKEASLDMNIKPDFDLIMNKLIVGDTIVVTKMDRFARSLSDACEIIQSIIDRGAKIHILDIGLLDDSIMGKLLYTTILSINEFEKALLVERIQSGKNKAKKTEGFKEGRPKKYTQSQIEEALKMLELYSYKKVEEQTGISKSTLIRAKKELSK